jgi:DNA-binding GntR family transcriptional regulator
MSGEQSLRSISGGELLADRAFKEMQEAIFSSRLSPGVALSVPELARQLGISRSPVREAVQRLVHTGLAVTVPYRGAVVARVDIEDLEQLYEVRELLEGLAARRATERLDERALANLEELVGEHRGSLDAGRGVRAHIEFDMRFHRTIRDLADSVSLSEFLETLQGKVQLAMHSLWPSGEAPWLALEDHEKILAAMASGDPKAAEEAARAHIARLQNTLVSVVESEEQT